MFRFFFLLLLPSFVFGSTKAVVFDCGGVVCEIYREYTINFIATDLEIPPSEALMVLRKYKKAINEGTSEEDFWKETFASLNKDTPKDWLARFEAMKNNAVIENYETLEIVKALQQRGFQTPMLSNVDRMGKAVLIKKGLYELFNPLLLSCDMGVEKPHPKAYEILIQSLNLQANEIIFIDDDATNVEAARSLGIDAIHFTNPYELELELMKKAVL